MKMNQWSDYEKYIVMLTGYNASVRGAQLGYQAFLDFKRVKEALEISSSRPECEWLEVNKPDFSGVYSSAPEREFLDSDINENLIVELYSK